MRRNYEKTHEEGFLTGSGKHRMGRNIKINIRSNDGKLVFSELDINLLKSINKLKKMKG